MLSCRPGDRLCQVRRFWRCFAQFIRLVVIVHKIAHLSIIFNWSKAKAAKVVIFPLTTILGTHPDEFLLVVGAGYENHSGTEQVFDRDFRVVRSVRLLGDYIIQILKYLNLWTIFMLRLNIPEKQTCVFPQGQVQRRWCQGSGHAPNSRRCPRRSASTRGRPPGSPCSRRWSGTGRRSRTRRGCSAPPHCWSAPSTWRRKKFF